MPIGMRTLLQLELLNTSLIGSDGGALDTDTILLDSLGSLNGDLVIGLVTVFETLQCLSVSSQNTNSCHKEAYQVIVLEVDVKETRQ